MENNIFALKGNIATGFRAPNIDDLAQNEQSSNYSKSIEEVCQENSEMNICMEGIEESINNVSSRNQSNDELLVNPYILDDHLGLFNEQ